MNYFLDVFSLDEMSDNTYALLQCGRLARLDERSGPCEDDVEVSCPFVDMLPDESGHEHGSPLRFGTFTTSLDDPRFVGSVREALLRPRGF